MSYKMFFMVVAMFAMVSMVNAAIPVEVQSNVTKMLTDLPGAVFFSNGTLVVDMSLPHGASVQGAEVPGAVSSLIRDLTSLVHDVAIEANVTSDVLYAQPTPVEVRLYIDGEKAFNYTKPDMFSGLNFKDLTEDIAKTIAEQA